MCLRFLDLSFSSVHSLVQQEGIVVHSLIFTYFNSVLLKLKENHYSSAIISPPPSFFFLYLQPWVCPLIPQRGCSLFTDHRS